MTLALQKKCINFVHTSFKHYDCLKIQRTSQRAYNQYSVYFCCNFCLLYRVYVEWMWFRCCGDSKSVRPCPNGSMVVGSAPAITTENVIPIKISIPTYLQLWVFNSWLFRLSLHKFIWSTQKSLLLKIHFQRLD